MLWEPKLKPKLPTNQSFAQPLDSPPEAGRAPNLPRLSSARPLRSGIGTASGAGALRVRTEQPNQRTRGEGGGVKRTTAGGLDLRRPDAECTPHRVRVALPAMCDLLWSRPQSHGSATASFHAFRFPILRVGLNSRHPTSDALPSALCGKRRPSRDFRRDVMGDAPSGAGSGERARR